MTESHASKTARLARAMLSKRRGGEAELWVYRRGHRGMVLRVSTEHEDGCLLLYCGDVATYRGPLRWSGCDFDVRAASDPATGDAVYEVLDQAVDFELRCGVIELKPMRSKYPD